MLAMEQSFGERGQSVRIKVKRNGADLEVTLVRDAQNAPPGPDPKSHLIYSRPVINWKGEFIPCMGAGPAGIAAIEFCQSRFKKDGYIKASEFGSTGFDVDRKNPDAAKIASITPGSAAEKAGTCWTGSGSGGRVKPPLRPAWWVTVAEGGEKRVNHSPPVVSPDLFSERVANG